MKKQKKKQNTKKEIMLASRELEGNKSKDVLGENKNSKPKSYEIAEWVEENPNADVNKLKNWVLKEYGSDINSTEASNLLIETLRTVVR